MLDKFYNDINLELFIQWIYGNKNEYDKNITCTLKNDKYQKTISFSQSDIKGDIVVWSNGIIEEQIFDEKNNILFYLHYKLLSLAQGQKMFYEFYESLTKYNKVPPHKIILCCSGGLSAAFFANKLSKLISLKHLNYNFIPIGFHHLEKNYHNCDAIYLAPQISYLLPKAMNIVNSKVPIYCINAVTYATHNYRDLLDIIINNQQKEADEIK